MFTIYDINLCFISQQTEDVEPMVIDVGPPSTTLDQH